MAQSNLDKKGDNMPHLGGAAAGGGVASVTAGDTTITIGGTATDPTVAVAQSANYNWTGSHVWDSEDNGTNTVTSLMTAQHRNNAAGTPAAGYGVSTFMKLDSSARTLRNAVEIQAVWSTATDGAEVSSIAFKTMLAGTATETVRFGTGATVPDADLSVSMGRALLDSRATDIAYFSHRDRTATTDYAIHQNANGQTRVNSASGQTCGLYSNNSVKLTVNTTGIGFFATTPVALQTGPTLNITNNVTSGGTDGTIANYTDLTVYANDAAAIRNDIYQLARAIKFASDALRAYGLLT